MQIIDGLVISRNVLSHVAKGLAQITSGVPMLTVVQVGDHPPSTAYIQKKREVAMALGIRTELCHLPESVDQATLLGMIDVLNASDQVHGILIQAPLPKHLDTNSVFARVHPDKDVDGFHPVNIAKLVQEDPSGFVPCTPAGIIELLKGAQIQTQGKHVVVIGRSLIVGKPMALLLMNKQHNASVTVCHSHTSNLTAITQQADILIAAMGRPKSITGDMIKPGAVLIDVGISRVQDPSHAKGSRLVGDIDAASVEPYAAALTPVPGGVGPMTVAMLMHNTLKAFLKHTS